MVEVQDPEGPAKTRPFRPRLPAVVAAVVVVIVGLALFPNRSPQVVEAATTEAAAKSFMEADLSVGADTRVGFIGLPPEGAPPSMPESGQLFLKYVRVGPRWSWVYTDGRVIRWWHTSLPEGANDRVTGLLEQRLTSEGVELLLSEISSSTVMFVDGFLGYDDRWVVLPDRDGVPRYADVGREFGKRLADLESWLPASAWEDQEVRAYVPSRYEVCRSPGVLPVLPAQVQDMLLAKDTSVTWTFFEVHCSAVTTEEARVFVEALDAWLAQMRPAGRPGEGSWHKLSYHINHPGDDEFDNLWIEPYLPHGEVLCSNCG